MIAGRLWDLLPAGRAEGSFLRRLKFRMKILRSPLEDRYFNWLAGFHRSEWTTLYSDEFDARVTESSPGRFLCDAMQRCPNRDAGTRAMLTDLQTYLPCDLLAKVDITSMAHGLECRSPFMDHHVVERAVAIPYRLIRDGGGVKPMLTSTFADLIPDRLRHREKMGFRIPVGCLVPRPHAATGSRCAAQS